MVLWEIALGTAYFLGLKRTYRLSRRIQLRIITPKYPKIRRFVHRRTRAVFDVAVKVNQNIQERDTQVGRNLGNSILRWLDRMKPSSQILGGSPTNVASSSVRMTRVRAGIRAGTSFHRIPSYCAMFRRGTNKHLFTSSSRIWPKTLPTIARMLQRPILAGTGTTTHYRHLSRYPPDVFRTNCDGNWSGGVIRKDIMQWMLHN